MHCMTHFGHAAALGFLLSAIPVAGIAQDGRILGQIDGEVFDIAISSPDAPDDGLMIELMEFSGGAELYIDLTAHSPGQGPYDAIMIGLTFEADGATAPAQFTTDMLVAAEVILIEDWPDPNTDPSTIWLAELDRAEAVDIMLDLTTDEGTVSGQFSSRRFCLHEVENDDFTPVLQNGGMICKGGAIEFTAASAGLDAPAAQGSRAVEVEILGRLEGMVGTDAFEWLTITRAGASATASYGQTDDGTVHLSLQGHSPASANFLYQDVLSLNIWTQAPVPEGESIPVEVLFVVDGEGPMPRVFYTSDDGEGQATATIWFLTMDQEEDRIELEVEGRLCRVEGMRPVEGDCINFQVRGATEIVDAGAPF